MAEDSQTQDKRYLARFAPKQNFQHAIHRIKQLSQFENTAIKLFISKKVIQPFARSKVK